MIKKLIFLILAVFLVWAYFALPLLGLYANDSGAKYIQMKSFYLNRWQRLGIEYPGKKIGLDFSYLNPNRYFVVRNNVLFCSYPPLFTFISSFFYPLLGDRVVSFLPLLAFFLAFFVFAKTLKLILDEGMVYYIWLFAFLLGSPIFLYSIIFWEHLPAILLVTLSLYYLTRYFKKGERATDLFLSCIILGTAIFFRTEMFILILSYFFALSWILFKGRQVKNLIVMSAGFVLPISVYALTNFIFYGSRLGLHGVYHRPYHFHLVNNIVYSALLFVAYLALYLLTRYGSQDFVRKLCYPILILWAAVILGTFRQSPVPALFWGFPLVFLLFFDAEKTIEEISSRRPGLEQCLFVTVITLVSLSAIWLFRNPDLDVRYMLGAVPFIVLFLALKSKTMKSSVSFCALAVILTVVTFSYGLYFLKNNVLLFTQYNAKRVEFLRENTKDNDVVIFKANPLMEHCGPLFFKRIYIISRKDGGDLAEILTVLKQKGINHCYFWTNNPFFSKQFFKDNPYKFTESVFSFKSLPNHYLIKIEL